MTESSNGFTRRIRVFAGYDHRDDPAGQRGAHGAELVLILRGELGAVSARVMTGWLPSPLAAVFRPGLIQARRDKPGVDAGVVDEYPIGGFVGAHSFEPREGLSADGPCDWLESAACWSDGSYASGDRVLELLVSGGDEAAFGYLAELYQTWIVGRPVVPVDGVA